MNYWIVRLSIFPDKSSLQGVFTIDTFAYGRSGETAIMSYFRRFGYAVDDKTDDAFYRERDVDMVISKANKSFRVEVKTDTRAKETGNIIVEGMMHRVQGARRGWFYFCEADILCYYIENAQKAYFLDWCKVKALILSGKAYPCKFVNPIDPHCIGSGWLLSIEKILRPNQAILWESKIIP